MEAPVARPRTGADDIARAMVVLALFWMWTLDGPPALIPGAFAAAAFVLHRSWARAPLAITALILSGLQATFATTNDPAALVLAVHLAPGVVVALATFFVRVGPREPDPAPSAVRDIPWDRGAPDRMQSIDDDPVLLAYLDAMAHLDQQQTRRLAAAWRAIDQVDRERAWAGVRAYVTRSGRERVLDEVRRAIEDWGRAAGGSPWTWSFGTMTDVDRGNVRRAAMPALLDGAAAVLARDELGGAEHDALAGPWEAATSQAVADERTPPVDAQA